MKDGAIVQAGTPEEIVLNPATAYVAEFTRNVSKAKVLRVQSIMKPSKGIVHEARFPLGRQLQTPRGCSCPGSKRLS